MTTTLPAVGRREFSLDLKYRQEEGRIFLTGIQGLVRVLLDQHRADGRRGLNTATLVSGYPGSPLAGLHDELLRQAKLLGEHQVRFVPGLNEDLAATAVWGSQMAHLFPRPKYDGVLGMWFGKAPGVDRSGDPLRHANFTGIGRNGGVLALAGDDPNAKSSTLPSDTSTTFSDLLMPLLYPGNVQEVLDLGLHGFELSRAAGLWVGFKVVTNVADAAGTAEVSPARVSATIPLVELDGRPFVPSMTLRGLATPRMVALEHEIHQARLELARQYAWENKLNRVAVPTERAWLGIVAAGKTYYDVRQALSELGLDDQDLQRHGIRVLQMRMVFPVEPRVIREFARGLEEILVVEEKRPFLETFVKEILYGATDRPAVVGKSDEEGRPLLPVQGELDSDVIARAIARRLTRRVAIESVEARARRLEETSGPAVPLPVARTPYFCSGCPHNRSLVVPEGSLVGAGIGCHGMAGFIDLPAVGHVISLTHMGGEGAQWVGASPFTETPHTFQNLGDGTFFHSGSLAVRFAVASGANVTYKLLYNSAVAMTGGQRATGTLPVPRLTRLLEAEGVEKIIVTTDEPRRYRRARLAKAAEVWHRDRLVEAESTLAAIPGVTVLIHDQQCAAEKRRRRKRGLQPDPALRLVINERVCEGCGDCGHKSNCLSVQPVETEFGRKTQIHQPSCNKDYSCLRGDCPSFVAVVPEGEPKKRERRSPVVDVELPEPALKVAVEDFGLYMMGIGGTGVVTVNQMLGIAALLDGKHVRALDQTGLSQKGGPVVSHLKLFAAETEVSNTVSAAGADLYLGFDVLVAAQPNHLGKADPRRTVAVVSTSRVPTGQMVTNTSVHFPEVRDIQQRIEAATRAGENFYLDAESMAEALFGDHMASNVVLLGAAYQLGTIPISADSIETAIRLNGVAVEMNLAAFRWGRLAVADPRRVEVAVMKAGRKAEQPREPSRASRELLDAAGATGELRRVLEVRVPELIDYQSRRYAREYIEFVTRVKGVEEERTPGRTAVAEAVARHLFKLMAYKDEYEVARLQVAAAFHDDLRAQFGERYKLYWYLQPPFLRALGLKRKMRLGRWFTPAFKVLRAMRRLRGTSLDPFGRASVRRTERALIAEYRAMVEAALAKLTTDNQELVAQLAQLPDVIRGYERVKLESVERYREQARQLAQRLG